MDQITKRKPLVNPDEMMEWHNALPLNRDMGRKNVLLTIQRTSDLYEAELSKLHALIERVEGHLVTVREVLPYIDRNDDKEGDLWAASVRQVIDTNLAILKELETVSPIEP